MNEAIQTQPGTDARQAELDALYARHDPHARCVECGEPIQVHPDDPAVCPGECSVKFFYGGDF